MIVREFLWWMRQAPSDLRVEATRDLVDCYLWGELETGDQQAVEAAMISLLDDPSRLVRFALAQNLAHSELAPRSVISGLARDNAEIAAIVLEHSPLLSEGELIDIIEISGESQQLAIVARQNLTTEVARALILCSQATVCLQLLQRPEFEQPELITLMLNRFHDDAEVSEAILQRGGLSPEQRAILVSKTADRLNGFISMTGWIKPERVNRMMRDSSDRGYLISLKNASANQLVETIFSLQKANKITPSLLLRSLLSGQRAFFETALAIITGLELSRIAGLIKDRSGRALAALLAKAGIPDALIPPFEIILATNHFYSSREGLNLQATSLVLNDYQQHGNYCDQAVLSLLSHFNTEAARDEARFYTSDLMREEDNILETNTMAGWNEAPEQIAFTETPANDSDDKEVDAIALFMQELEAKTSFKKAA